MNRRPQGIRLFTVSLIADTHVNEEEHSSASPYPANAEANPRARHVFAEIERQGPAFAIHLGDIVNPVPELPTYADAAERFHALARGLSVPLHLVPGNHDVGDKCVDWMPAGTVADEYLTLYEKHFGRHYFAVDHDECHFVMINAQLVNSGLDAESEQAAWLERDLADNEHRRTFLFTHYPPYVSTPDEPGSYDNIDEPGRGWLLELIRRYRPEALFAAHVHNFWYDVIGDTELYILPSTSFVRHDYAEMYRIEAGDQHGRNDVAKLGHVTLEIHERGHVAHYHRSYGRSLAEADTPGAPRMPCPHTKTSTVTGVLVDMRHAWAEEMVIAPSGAIDEFARKRARNDYPLMALWEMGLRGLRVPLQDLLDPATRRRMALMCDVGHRFQVHCYGLPGSAEDALLREHRALVDRLELVLDWDGIGTLRDAVRELGQRTGIPLLLSRVNRRDTAKRSGKRFHHLISHGFGLEEIDELAAFAKACPGVVQGAQFTIARDVDPWDATARLARFADGTDLVPVLYVKSTGASPAESYHDDEANAERVGQALLAGTGHGVDVILDTFDDIDRGYFTRSGLVDRRFNPRTAGRLVSALIARLDGGEWHADGKQRRLRESGGATLSVSRAGAAVAGTEGSWLCPRTGRSGPCAALGDEPGDALVVLKTVRTES